MPANGVPAQHAPLNFCVSSGMVRVINACHVFRATGITAYLDKGGTLENAQLMAAHESPRGAHEHALS